MRKYAFALLLLAFQSSATISCLKTATGTTICSGADKSGNQVSTTSHTTATGTTYTSGKDGGANISQQCFTTATATGTTYCQ